MGNDNGCKGIQQLHLVKHCKHRDDDRIGRDTHSHGKQAPHHINAWKPQPGDSIGNHGSKEHGKKY